MLCPIRKKKDRSAEEPNEFELNSIRNDPDKLATIRKRLSDVAWWMRLLCQNIGTRANQEDKQVGKFSRGRYRAVRILDEETLLACSAYVDLNPIRAAMAETLETSEFTSVQRRIQSLKKVATIPSYGTTVDSMLSPLTIDEGDRGHRTFFFAIVSFALQADDLTLSINRLCPNACQSCGQRPRSSCE